MKITRKRLVQFGLGAIAVAVGMIAQSSPALAAGSTAPSSHGETIVHEPGGVTVVTAKLTLKPGTGSGHAGAVKPNGYGQNPGDCGTAKLWTYAGSGQFQLSLIGNEGVSLGLGNYEFDTNGLASVPVFGAITAIGPTWTSGRVSVPIPGLWANAAKATGLIDTSIGECVIAVGAVWN